MMAGQSAGILFYRISKHHLEVLLVHPGGPFWAKKDQGAWSIPKGEFNEKETPIDAARREVAEELGVVVPGELLQLTPVMQKGGKLIHAWAASADFDAATITSNTFELEWPPRSGKKHSFPEVDRAEWFGVAVAIEKINPAQAGLIEELERKLSLRV
jgi:predicted NUDIX family NTP pyrophosphohydrolase